MICLLHILVSQRQFSTVVDKKDLLHCIVDNKDILKNDVHLKDDQTVIMNVDINRRLDS